MTPESPAWVDPASLPDHGDVSATTGNVGDDIKRLNYNTFFSYGVGDEDCFGYLAGKDVKFVDINVDRRLEHHGRLEATTIAEVVVSKSVSVSSRCIKPSSKYALFIHRYAERCWYATWWLHNVSHRQVSCMNLGEEACNSDATVPLSCCSTPLVVLGLVQGVNGVGVTQGMNVLFHSPASL